MLVIFSCYSTWTSNRLSHSSIQVLVTVAFANVSGCVFICSVYTNTSSTPLKVWYNDGTLIYGSYAHMTLMMITWIIVGALLIPYIILKVLMKSARVRKYLQPID